MILILAEAGEAWAVPVEQELLRRDQPVCRVDAHTILDSIALNWLLDDPGDRPSVLMEHANGRVIPLNNLQSIFLRAEVGRLAVVSGQYAPQDQVYVERELSAAWYGWLHAQSCPVVNLPVFGHGGSLAVASVAFHRAAMQAGLVPVGTTVHSHIHRTHEWFERHNRDARVWPIGGREAASYLRGAEGRDRLSEWIEAGPVAMQPIPEGTRMHAFVVGEAVIGGVRRTATKDGRLLPSVLDHATVAPDVAQRCRRLTRARQMSFAELELVLGSDGTMYCLSLSGDPVYARCSDVLRKTLVLEMSVWLAQAKEMNCRDSRVRPDYRSYRFEPLDAPCRQVG